LVLQTACSISAEGGIIGIALAKGTANDYHAYLATPILNDENSESDAPVVDGADSKTAKFSEDVRDLIRQRWFSAARLAARLTQPQ